MQRAGKRNVRVRLERMVQTKDSRGGTLKSWVPIQSVWAGIRAKPGNEARLTTHGGQDSITPAEVSIVFRTGIDERCRVVRGATVYNIRSVINVGERNENLLLVCDTEPSGGA